MGKFPLFPIVYAFRDNMAGGLAVPLVAPNIAHWYVEIVLNKNARESSYLWPQTLVGTGTSVVLLLLLLL